MRKIEIIVLCLALTAGTSIILADIAHTQTQQAPEKQIEQIEGHVASFDWVASTLILKFLAGSNFEEMEFYLPPGTEIIKLEEHIEFSDVELDDLARVNFYFDKNTGKNVVVRMEIVV